MSAMYNCKFSKVNLNEAVLFGADFEGSDFFCGSFQKANLCYAKFHGANCVNADFRGADLEGTIFEGADLRGADLRGANLKNTRFEKSNLKDVKVDDDAPVEVLAKIPEALGRKIFLEQLRTMGEHGFTIKWLDPDDQEYPHEALDLFKIPRGLTSAFLAYNNEYFISREAHSFGDVFEDQDDPSFEVMNKVRMFMMPFIRLLESLYSVKLKLHVETSKFGTSHSVVVTQNQRVDFVVYLLYWQVWESLFDRTDPSTVYSYLEAVFRKMESRLLEGLKIVS